MAEPKLMYLEWLMYLGSTFNIASFLYIAYLFSPAHLERIHLKLCFPDLLLVLRKLFCCGTHHQWEEATVINK